MSLSFAIISLITIAAAVGAMSMRRLVHCALALPLVFAGLAAAYLQLGAQFVGFAQVLVYIGAVAILIVFAVLLTRGGEDSGRSIFSQSWRIGAVVAAAVLAVLVWAINHSVVMKTRPPPQPEITVRQIGEALMTRFVLPFEVMGLLLTAALIGAVIIAMHEEENK